MKNLNLPAFDVKLGGTAEQPKIWDILRRKYVALTPEEWVRQHFIHFLTEHKHYPAALLANEVGLQIGNKQLRADSVALHPAAATEDDCGIQGTTHRDNATCV